MSSAHTYKESPAHLLDAVGAPTEIASAPDVQSSSDSHWMLDLMSEPVVRYRLRDGRISYCNAAWAAHYSVTKSTAIGRSVDHFLSSGGDPQCVMEWLDHSVDTDDGTETVSIGSDVTQMRQLQQELDVVASTDALTGLTNRRALERELDSRLDDATSTGSHVSVVFLDLDAMKTINERHGHDAGDTVLREIAQRLERACDRSDVVARLGGAEFAVVRKTSIETGMRWINRLSARLEQPIDIDHSTSVTCRASIGVATSDDFGYSARKLLAAADRLMYEKRNSRRGRRSTDS